MDMTMQSCRNFVEALASSSPAPGGGGAAALVGAIGAALGNMVASLTIGKKKYAAVEAEIAELKTKPPKIFQLPLIFSGCVVVAPVASSYVAFRVIAFIVFE